MKTSFQNCGTLLVVALLCAARCKIRLRQSHKEKRQRQPLREARKLEHGRKESD